MIKREPDYSMAYLYARGYFDGRANAFKITSLHWMTPEEVAIYGRGYDKGIADYNKLDEGKAA